MTSYRPVDSKREEFRKYLERAGVMESLTRVLVSLYEEPDKGIDALEYVRNHLAENNPNESTAMEELRADMSRLVAENKMLRKRLSQYEEVPSVLEADASPAKSESLHQSERGSELSGQSKTSSRNIPAPNKNSERQPSISSTQKD